MNQKKQSRRKFIKQSATVTTGLVLASQFPMTAFSKPASKSKVIIAHSDAVIDADGNVNQEILRQLLDEAIVKLSGKKDTGKAWGEYFTKEDVIGLKVNGNSYSVLQGTPMANHYPLLTHAIIKSIAQADIPESNAIVWERSDKELETMGYQIQKDDGKLRVMGTYINRRSSEEETETYQPGFAKTDHPVGDKTTRFSNIIERDCTALINLPCLKSHRLAGVTGALKNHYGSIDNPRDFHDDDCCNPGIPEINNLPVIRDKHRLVICNALMGLWDGGPRWDRSKMWMEGSLIIGVDPVAVDAVMLELIDKKRIENGLNSVSYMTKFLQLSEEIGLGNSKAENIELIKIEV